MNDKLYIETQLESRKTDKVSTLYKDVNNLNDIQNLSLIINSNSDIGVVRNGGRKGSAYAPKSILPMLLGMAIPEKLNMTISSIDIVNPLEEKQLSFNDLQLKQSRNIDNILEKTSPQNIFHLGGGHDHIYPLVLSLSKHHKKIKILNIDAHLDTRIDSHFHSGTPFRQISQINGLELQLSQWGIKDLSNARTNYQAIKMDVISSDQIKDHYGKTRELIHSTFLNNIKDDEIIVLSLDTDVIHSSSMEAVSAVNPTGLSFEFIETCFLEIKRFCLDNNRTFICGIYEYNPIFDNLSNKGSRLLAELIYKTLFLED